MLQAILGSGRVLVREGDRRVAILNAEASLIWELQNVGLETHQIVEILAERFGQDIRLLQEQVHRIQADWRGVGLLDPTALFPVSPDEGCLPDREATTPVWPAGTLAWDHVGLRVGVWIEDKDLRTALTALIPFRTAKMPPAGHLLALRGSSASWRLDWNERRVESGHGYAAALVTTLQEITERACRAGDRLLVVHGAGLATADGRGLLLIAPGGSGKTTLAAALNAKGLPLLHDDVVPVDLDGQLWGLGLPLTLKSGSWPVLEQLRPELADATVTQRMGQPVRFLSPRGSVPTAPIPLGAFIFPCYQPHALPHLESLPPESTLQRLIEAEAVIRNLNQDKLERLARWVESAPAWTLTYPDLATGLEHVDFVVRALTA